MAKFQQYLGAKLTNNTEKTTESFHKIYKEVLRVLDEDTWSSCKRRKIEDLYFPIKQKIFQELEKDFSDYLAEQANKKQRFHQSLVAKFEQNLGMPQNLKFEKFFDEQRVQKFHQGMIEWVRKSLKEDSQIAVSLLEKICKYYENYAVEARSVAQLEIEKKNDDLEIEKKTLSSYKEMI